MRGSEREYIDRTRRLRRGRPDGRNSVIVDLEERRQLKRMALTRSRRSDLKAIGVTGILGLAAALGLYAVIERKPGVSLTEEQKVVAGKYTEISDSCLVHDLVVGRDGAILRNRPSAAPDLEAWTGDYKGELDPGVKVEKAMVVYGNNPNNTLTRGDTAPWFAFRDPSGSDDIVFSSESNFSQSKNPQDFCPIPDLSPK